MKQYFRIFLISISFIATSLTFMSQNAIAQPLPPKREDISLPFKLRISMLYIRSLNAKSPISTADLSQDGKILITSSGGNVQLWNILTGENKTFSLLDNKYARIEAVAINPDLQTFVTTSAGLDIKIKHSSPENCGSANNGSFGFSCNLGSFSSQRIKNTSGRAIQVWNLSTGKQSGILEYSSMGQQISFDFSQFITDKYPFLRFSGSEYLMSRNSPNKLKIWNVKTGKVINQLDSEFCMAFSSDYKTYAVNSVGFLNVFRPKNSTNENPLLYKLPTQNYENCKGFAFTPDGQILANANSDGTIQFWNMKDGQEIKYFMKPIIEQRIIFLGFSPIELYNDSSSMIPGLHEKPLTLIIVNSNGNI